MGKDIHVKIAKYNPATNLYEELQLFRKRKPDEKEYDYETKEHFPQTQFKELEIYLGRNYSMFDGMKYGTKEDGYGYFPWTPVNLLSLEFSLKEKIKKEMSYEGTFDFYEINLTDFYNYLHNHPFIADENNEDNNFEKKNPLQDVMNTIENFINIADENLPYTPLKINQITNIRKN